MAPRIARDEHDMRKALNRALREILRREAGHALHKPLRPHRAAHRQPVVGVGGTFLTLWVLSLLVDLLKKVFPLQAQDEAGKNP